MRPLANFIKRSKDYRLVGRSSLFDANYYGRKYPEVVAAGIDPLTHYMEYGYREGKKPSAFFDPKYYLDANPDVARSGANPLLHWLRYGMHEGRSVALNDTGNTQAFHEMAVVISSGLFDEAFYADQYPDAIAAGLSPIEHYMRYGGLEGRNPSPDFDAKRYLFENPDVARDRVNPVVHWIKYGRFERRNSPLKKASAFNLNDFCNPVRREQNQTISFQNFSISVITPAFNTDPHLLEELYQSLANQIYVDWEWVIVDDCSTRWDTLATLRKLTADDVRVKTIMLSKNLGISGASNEALRLAEKEFIALVDHDDLLSRDAFLSVAEAWRDNNQIDMFYTDECKLSVNNEVYDIYLKPDYSPSYIENTMYIGHLTVYRREFVKTLGGFRSEYDGTQDFDLALRAFGRTQRIRHVDCIAYLWRAIPNSSASLLETKSSAVDRQLDALLEYATDKNKDAKVRPGKALGFWTIDFPVIGDPLVSFVIPTAGGSREVGGVETLLLENCLDSFKSTAFCKNCEFVIVHNGNLGKEREARLRARSDVRLIEYNRTPFNLAEKINVGVEAAAGEFVCLLNDDTQAITAHGGDRIVAYMQASPRVGAMGALLLFEDGLVQHNGMVLLEQGPSHYAILQRDEYWGHAYQFICRRDVIGVTGALMFVRREDFLKLGGFDERLPFNYNDIDFCIRLRATGRTCVVDPGVRAYHFESASQLGTLHCERERFLTLNADVKDPYFNRLLDQSDPSTKIGDRFQQQRNFPHEFRVSLDEKIKDRSGHRSVESTIMLTVGMPVFNQPVWQLRESFRSISMQTYPHVEFIIVDDGSTDTATIEWLERIDRETSAKVLRHARNRGIFAANRSIRDAMSGEFLLLVDADDYITADAVQVMADAIRSNPRGVIFYSDEFKADVSGLNFAPFYKPDFDPVLIFNCCYPTHLMAISRHFLNRIDAYADQEATWCHDYDCLTKALALGVDPIHVSELLYAWRISPGSTASAGSSAKPQVVESQRFVLERLLKAKSLSSVVGVESNELFDTPDMWRVSARDSLHDIMTFEASDFWASSDVGRRLQEAAERPGYTALIAASCIDDCDRVLRELSAPIMLDGRVVSCSGIATTEDMIVTWSGGLLSPHGIVEPYAGEVFGSGYHGQLFCQRCADVLLPVNIIIKNEIIKYLLPKDGRDVDARDFVVSLGVYAHDKDLFCAVTPHVCLVGKLDRAFLPLDRGSFGRAARTSRWLGRFAEHALRPSDR